jgi:integrase
VRGRLQKLEGRFHLREGLAAPGEIAVPAAVDLVVAEMRAQAAAGWVTTDVVEDSYVKFLRSFARYMPARGAHTVSAITMNLIVEWMVAPSAAGPAPRNVQMARRSTARAFFALCARLGLHDQNPALAVEIGARPPRHVCPFTDAEIDHLKTTAAYQAGETQTPALIALMVSAVTSGELAYVRDEHIDLPGNRIIVVEARSQFVRPRTVPIHDQWCRNALAARLRAVAGQTPWLVYQGASESPGARNSAVSARVTQALKRAGIYRPGQTRIASITEWVARDAFRATGSLTYVANLLGMSSLDIVADLVGHDWQVRDVPPTAGR